MKVWEDSRTLGLYSRRTLVAVLVAPAIGVLSPPSAGADSTPIAVSDRIAATSLRQPRAPLPRRNWKWRYFVLDEGWLVYFESDKKVRRPGPFGRALRRSALPDWAAC